MALKVKEIAMPFGVAFSDVYFKINRISYNDEDKVLYFAGAFYVNEEARQSGMKPLESGILCETISLEDKTVNMYEYLYNYIKAKAIEVSAMTDEEIYQQNEEAKAQQIENGEPIHDVINTNYRLFLNAEDC